MPVPISALYASILALFLIVLAIPVIRLRWQFRVGLGDGGQKSLQQAVRAHGNAVEYIPVFIILLGFYELNHASPTALHAFGAGFVLSRLAHAWGLYARGGVSIGRTAGVVGTFALTIALAIANIIKVLG